MRYIATTDFSSMHGRMPTKRFFVTLINGRCGSSLLTGYLNMVPDVLSYPEILSELDAEQQSALLEALTRGHAIEQINDHARSKVFFNEPFEQKVSRQLSSVGFKTKYGDIHHLDNFVNFLKEKKFEIILLRRKNILQSALSRLRAQYFYRQYGDYNINSAGQHIGSYVIDIEKFALLLNNEQRYYDDLNDVAVRSRDRGRHGCAIWYEDLIAAPAVAVSSVLNILQSNYRVRDIDGVPWVVTSHEALPVHPLVMKTLKMTSDVLKDVIDNYDDFHRHFAKTKYGEFLQS